MAYVDESGLDNRLCNEFGRALRGKKILADFSGKRHKRISMLAPLIGKKLIAPKTFIGGCNAKLFNEWLKEELLLPRGTVETRESIESAGCYLMYLPNYSPNLNPIEPYWHRVKS